MDSSLTCSGPNKRYSGQLALGPLSSASTESSTGLRPCRLIQMRKCKGPAILIRRTGPILSAYCQGQSLLGWTSRWWLALTRPVAAAASLHS